MPGKYQYTKPLQLNNSVHILVDCDPMCHLFHKSKYADQ